MWGYILKRCPKKSHHYAFDNEYTHCPYCGSPLIHYEGKTKNEHISMKNLANRIDLYDIRFQIEGYVSVAAMLFAIFIFSMYVYDITHKNQYIFIGIFTSFILIFLLFNIFLLHISYKKNEKKIKHTS